MFDHKDPRYVYPPAAVRMQGYAQGSPPNYVPRGGHKWWPGKWDDMYEEGFHCKQCGLRMWVDWDSVYLSRRTPDGDMPTCEESAPEQVMNQ